MRSTVLSVVVMLALAGCAGAGGGSAAATAPASRTLPDGRTASPAEAAFLDQVTPSLPADTARDVLGVLHLGQEDVCGLYLHPSDPAVQATARDGLVTNDRLSPTQAALVVQAAVEHLCPGK